MTVAVLQAGSWGTTLATILARDGGKDVVLWIRDAAQAKESAARRENHVTGERHVHAGADRGTVDCRDRR